MSKQISLFRTSNNNDKISLGNNIFIEIESNYPRRAYLVSDRKPSIFRLRSLAGSPNQREHLFQIEENLK